MITRRRDREKDDGRLGTLMRATFVQGATVNEQFSQVQELSEEQQIAVDGTVDWFLNARTGNAPRLWVFGGHAGCGKSTSVGFIAQDLCRNYRIAFCAPTGKAAGVLARSLRAVAVEPPYCGTIHRMIYTPQDDGDGTVSWKRKEKLEYDLIVVDEASMLSRELLEDLLEYEIPILAVGDHGQLPPVGEDVSIMSNPNVKLETIHRQALGNPILEFATLVRSGGNWRALLKASKDERLQILPRREMSMIVADRFSNALSQPAKTDPLILCATNKTRKMLNSAARVYMPQGKVLLPGERVICLKNSYLSGALLANGFRGTVTSVVEPSNPLHLKAQIVFHDEELELVDGLLCKPQIGAEKTFAKHSDVAGSCYSWTDAGLLFDYSYASTTWKAQGSQADEVILYVEDIMKSDEEFRRFLYTSATRAIKKLAVAL